MTHEEMTQRTKHAFADALKNLMKEKPLNKITVKDLVTACNVNRKTFYYYFTDIYDLLRWILDEEALKVVEQFNMVTDLKEAIGFVIDYMEENDYLLKCIYDSLGIYELDRFLRQDFHALVRTQIDRYEKELNLSLSSSYKHFVTDFYADGIAGLIIEWVQTPSHPDKESVVTYVETLLNASISSVLQAGVQLSLPNEEMEASRKEQ